MRLTDRNGSITPIAIPVPAPSAGLTPDTGVVPYTAVNVYARLEGFEQVENENLASSLAVLSQHWRKV